MIKKTINFLNLKYNIQSQVDVSIKTIIYVNLRLSRCWMMSTKRKKHDIRRRRKRLMAQLKCRTRVTKLWKYRRITHIIMIAIERGMFKFWMMVVPARWGNRFPPFLRYLATGETGFSHLSDHSARGETKNFDTIFYGEIYWMSW